MTDLEKLATETAGILLNWGKTTAHPDWRAPNEQQIALAMSYMQEAQEQGRIEGLEGYLWIKTCAPRKKINDR